MGHWHCDNISRLVIRQVYAHGNVCVRDMAEFARKKGEEIHASEGSYSDPEFVEEHILSMAILHVERGTLEPVFPDHAARELYFAFRDPQGSGCDWWDTRPEDYHAMLKIPFRFAPGQRRKYPNVPHFSEIDS